MKPIEIVSATKGDSSKCLLWKYAQDIPINFEENNKRGLPAVYNQYIVEQYKHHIIAFVHDDVAIEDAYITEKLNKAMETYDVVGLAGIKDPITIKEPALWHLMGDRSQLSGAVAHFTGKDDNERFMTHFGVTPARVIMLDGVFLAINVEKCLEKGVYFDITNPARFHYYDIDFSLNANRAGLKIGTWPIWITHKSHGLTKPDEEFYKGQSWFIKKWS